MAASTDNNDEWYTVDCGPFRYTLPVRYQNTVFIGQGAFGAVIRAKDTVTGKDVAIRKILNPFQSSIHAQRTYRELKLLMYLNHPDAQVVQLYNVFTPDQTLEEFQTLYFVFNYAGFSFDKAIRHLQVFSEDHVQLIIYSLLRSLKFMHSAGVIHCDLEPQYIGIDQNTNITILNFGSARVTFDDLHTDYVSIRGCRASEIFMNCKPYNEKVDIWSVGCIMAELILLRTVFRGNHIIDQLNKIFDILGTPDPATVAEIYTPEASAFIWTLTPKPKKDYNQLFGFKYEAGTQKPTSGLSPQGVALLDRLLSFDHRVRPTAEEALGKPPQRNFIELLQWKRHHLADPFFESLHDPMDEPTIDRMVDEHADATYITAHWKSIIWQMVEEFLAPSWVTEPLSKA